MRAKTSCFDGLTSFLCKNMRSENSVSDLVSKGLLTVLGIFVAENGGNERRFERYAFSLKAISLISASETAYR